MTFFQWNPHWECFSWNEGGCADHVLDMTTDFLKTHDVDFANLVELSYVRPVEGFSAMVSGCTGDFTYLYYNSDRWERIDDQGAWDLGCIVGSSRGFVVQAFKALKPAAGPLVPDKVVVVGAHFPHPGGTEPLSPSDVAHLVSSISTALKTVQSDQVVLIADTNEFRSTSSAEIGDYLGFPGSERQSTSLERTCCVDNNFQPDTTFDRVIANFGASMKTDVLMNDPLPSWVRQTRGGQTGAFHKPLLGTLTVLATTTTTTTTEPGSTTSTTTTTVDGGSGLSAGEVALIVIGALVLVAAVGFLIYYLWRQRQLQGERARDAPVAQGAANLLA